VFYPFHGDHNSFQVDQVWLASEEGTDESRAGFMFSILYGNNASSDAQGFNSHPRRDVNRLDEATTTWRRRFREVPGPGRRRRGVRPSASSRHCSAAEVVDASKNWNITRGNEWTLLQSIDHLGLLTSTTVGPIVLAAESRIRKRPRGLARHQTRRKLPRQIAFAPEGQSLQRRRQRPVWRGMGPRASLDSASPGP